MIEGMTFKWVRWICQPGLPTRTVSNFCGERPVRPRICAWPRVHKWFSEVWPCLRPSNTVSIGEPRACSKGDQFLSSPTSTAFSVGQTLPQRRTAEMEILQTLLHSVIFMSYVYGLYYDVKPPKGSEYESAFWAMGGRFKYLTFLDAVSIEAAGKSAIQCACIRNQSILLPVALVTKPIHSTKFMYGILCFIDLDCFFFCLVSEWLYWFSD